MTVRFVRDPIFLLHDAGPFHPESSWRYQAILQVVPPADVVELGATRFARVEEVAKVHDRAWVEAVLSGRPFEVDIETRVSEHSAECVARASGAVLDAIDAALDHGHHSFVAVRPPGHHAVPHTGMGFCLVHHAAVGVAHALERVERVAVVDWDVHWGNGTSAIFHGRRDVLAISLHEDQLYPAGGAREDDAEGAALHLPLPAGTDDDVLLATFDEHALPRLRAFQPELIVVCAGFDGHVDDPMSGWRLTERAYAALTARLRALDVPLVVVLEGGYDPASLRRSVEATLEALC